MTRRRIRSRCCPAAEYADIYRFAYCGAAREPAVQTAGDLNGDGRFSVADAVLLSRILSESGDYASAAVHMEQADVNADGMIDLRDMTAMLSRLQN